MECQGRLHGGSELEVRLKVRGSFEQVERTQKTTPRAKIGEQGWELLLEARQVIGMEGKKEPVRLEQ